MMNLKSWVMDRLVGRKVNRKHLQYLCLICLALLGIVIGFVTYLIIDVLYTGNLIDIRKRTFYVDYEEDLPPNIKIPIEIKTIEVPETENYDLLERCIEAEAGNQGYLGKAYVCDVILNRLDSGRWGDTLEDVILYPNAFSVVSNGTIDVIDVTLETKNVVANELKHRTDNDIISFKTGSFHYGLMPAFKYKDHYFSK